MVDFDMLSWVVRGKQKTAVLKAFSNELTPSQLYRLTKMHSTKITLSNVSDIVRGFVKKGIALCLTPKNKTGRIYKLTDKGEEIRDGLLTIDINR